MGKQQNEGEGNRTAAKEYNKETKAFVKSGRVGEAAAEAKRAMDGAEGKDLDAAHDEAAAHAKEHDPEETRDYKRRN